MASRDITVRILGDATSARRALGQVNDATTTTEGRFAKFGAAIKAAALVGGVALIKLGKDSVDAFNESHKVGAQTEAVLKSTGGAANVTAKEIGALATKLQALSGVEDETIQAGQNMLLTFTNLKNEAGKGNDVFDQATKTLLDMSVALGTDAKTSAIQLGKALNDPIAGIGALSRVGVTFNAEQKNLIKTLVESGNVMGAQKVILAELNKEFGGSAKAAGDAQSPMERLTLKFGDLQEKIGAALIPALEKLTSVGLGVIDFVSNLDPKVLAIAGALAGFVVTVFAITKAMQAWKAIQLALNVVLLANPIGLVVLAVAALAAAVFIISRNTEKFRDVFLGVVEAVVKGAARAFGWVPGIGPKLREAAGKVERFRDEANAALGDVKAVKIDVDVNIDSAVQFLSGNLSSALAESTTKSKELRDAILGTESAQRSAAKAAQAVGDAERSLTDQRTKLNDALRKGAVDAKEVVSAQKAVADAERSLADATLDLAERRDKLNEALRDGAVNAKSVASAEKDMIASARSLGDAQERLVEAQERLDKLRAGPTAENVAKGELRIEDAAIDLLRAEKRLADAHAALNKVRSEGDQQAIADAELTIREAVLALTRAQLGEKDANNDLAEARAAALPGSKEYEAAERSVSDATEAVTDATGRQEDAAQKLRDARAGDPDYARTIAGLQRDVADAERSVTNAIDGQKEAATKEREARAGDPDFARNIAGLRRDVADAERGVGEAKVASRLASISLKDAQVEENTKRREGIALTAEHAGQVLGLTDRIRGLSDAIKGIPPALVSGIKTDINTITNAGRGDGPGAGRAGTALATVQRAMQGIPGLAVTSGFRTPAANAAVGGSPTSYHMDRANPAIDVGGTTASLDALYARLKAVGGRELLWRTAGHFDHLHYAHDGGTVSSSWPTLPGLRGDERPAVLQVGETVIPKGGGVAVAPAPVINNYFSVVANVAGNVTAERDLAETMIREFQEWVRRNGTLGL